jgi:hypothetical protein
VWREGNETEGREREVEKRRQREGEERIQRRERRGGAERRRRICTSSCFLFCELSIIIDFLLHTSHITHCIQNKSNTSTK